MTDSLPPITAPTAARTGRLRRFDLLWLVAIYVARPGRGGRRLAAARADLRLLLRTVRPISRPSAPATSRRARSSTAILVAAFVFFLGSLWLARRRGIDRMALGFVRTAPRWYLVGAVIFVLFFLFDAAVFHVLDPTGALENDLTSKPFSRPARSGWAIVVALAVGPLTAVAEETLFRGLVYRWFRERWGIVLRASLQRHHLRPVAFLFRGPGGLRRRGADRRDHGHGVPHGLRSSGERLALAADPAASAQQQLGRADRIPRAIRLRIRAAPARR